MFTVVLQCLAIFPPIFFSLLFIATVFQTNLITRVVSTSHTCSSHGSHVWFSRLTVPCCSDKFLQMPLHLVYLHPSSSPSNLSLCCCSVQCLRLLDQLPYLFTSLTALRLESQSVVVLLLFVST